MTTTTTTTTKPADTLRVHRDIFPATDHGYTWIETVWFERDGKRVSPTMPAAGCTERLGHMPGGSIPARRLRDDEKHYCGGLAARTVKSETVHPEYHHVGTICIRPVQ